MHVAAVRLPVDVAARVCVFVFVCWTCCVFERQREKSHCSVPPYLPSRWTACAVSPLSDVTRL